MYDLQAFMYGWITQNKTVIEVSASTKETPTWFFYQKILTALIKLRPEV